MAAALVVGAVTTPSQHTGLDSASTLPVILTTGAALILLLLLRRLAAALVVGAVTTPSQYTGWDSAGTLPVVLATGAALILRGGGRGVALHTGLAPVAPSTALVVMPAHAAAGSGLTVAIDENGAVVVGDLVLVSHDFTERFDCSLLIGLLQLVDVGGPVGAILVLHHGLDEYRHDNVLGLVVRYERNGRVGFAAVVVIEGIVEVLKEEFRRCRLCILKGPIGEDDRVAMKVSRLENGVAIFGDLEDAIVRHLDK